MQMPSLIMDVGMHLGYDTQFYLDKGFSVVGIEANPNLVEENRRKFERYITSGALVIVPCAIAEAECRVPFYIFPEKSDWGTADRDFATRNASRGTRHTTIEVPSVTFASLLERYGVPYYLKIDIEGSDVLCLRPLHRFSERPKYISLEMPLLSFEKALEALSHLVVLGYRRFKVVNQTLNYRQRCPYPPREGRYVDTRFHELMSGPFGEEAPGEWLNEEQCLARCRRILKANALFCQEGHFPMLRGVYNGLARLLGTEPLGCHDIHAQIGAQESNAVSAPPAKKGG